MSESARTREDMTSADSAKILKGPEFEVLSRARANVESAQQEAENILAQAREEAAQIRAEAHARGREEAARVLAEHTASVVRDLDAMEPRLTGIVMDALRRVLDPIPPEDLAVAAVRRAMAEVDLSRGATLIVAPAALSRVQEHLGRFDLVKGTLELRGDPSCPPDSTILRTVYGDIELDIDAQIAALSEGIEAALSESGA